MKKPLIADKLIEIENKLEYQKTPVLRAESALSLINIEKENLKNIDLLKGASQGLNEMFTEMDKVDLLSEYNMAIKILTHFIDNNSFSLIAIQKFDNDQTKLFEEINKKLEEVVSKYDNDSAQFHP
jgi:hypothetical protein